MRGNRCLSRSRWSLDTEGGTIKRSDCCESSLDKVCAGGDDGTSTVPCDPRRPTEEKILECWRKLLCISPHRGGVCDRVDEHIGTHVFIWNEGEPFWRRAPRQLFQFRGAKLETDAPLLAVQVVNLGLYSQVMSKVTAAAYLQFCILIGIKRVPEAQRLFDLLWRTVQALETAHTVQIFAELFLGHGMAIEHGPPQGLVFAPMKLHDMSEERLETPAFCVCRRPVCQRGDLGEQAFCQFLSGRFSLFLLVSFLTCSALRCSVLRHPNDHGLLLSGPEPLGQLPGGVAVLLVIVPNSAQARRLFPVA